ncbi:hypothetical protein [Botrimarina sp.]|uniref:hypothetical protein n=1 Tax=Botrimarina sp. TaxID=2795802 RepID=UPI0032EE9156
MLELTPDQQRFVESEVAAGGFSDASAVVQAAVELYRRAKPASADRYQETVLELHAAIPDIEAARGRPIGEVYTAIADKLHVVG